MSPDTTRPPGRPLEDALAPRVDAFLAKYDEVCSLLDRYEHPDNVVLEGHDEHLRESLVVLGVLDFVGWVFMRQDRGEFLSRADLTSEAQKKIKDFLRKYSTWATLLTRLHRQDQGYENEITGLAARPFIYLKNLQPGMQLEFRSHDKLILTSRQNIAGFVSLAQAFLENIEDFVTYTSLASPQLLQIILGAEPVQQLRKKCSDIERLLAAEEKPLKEEAKEP